MKILLIEGLSQYRLHHGFNRALRKGFRNLKRCKVSLLSVEEERPEDLLINQIKRFEPDLIVKINQFKWQIEDKDFFDYLGIPFFNMLIDHPLYHISNYQNIKSEYLYIACTDRSWAEYLKQRLGLKNVIFLPHGGCVSALHSQRNIDVYFAGSYQDFACIKNMWPSLEEKAQEILDAAEDLLFKNSYIDFEDVIKNVLQRLKLPLYNPNDLTHLRQIEAPIYKLLEMFARNKIRYEVIKTLKNHNLLILGNGWENLKIKGDLLIRPSIDYLESLELIGKSKIVLSIAPQAPDGSHERVFDGMAANCLVFSTKSRYLEEVFVDGEDIVFFDFRDLKTLKEKIGFYLYNEKERERIAASGREKVMKNHLWYHRASSILDYAEKD